MKKFSLIFSAIGLMSMATSCSQYQLVNSEVYNNANFADYHTFRIVTPDEGRLPDGMEMVTYENIASAIAQQMEARGFVQDPNSDLLINIAVTTRRQVEQVPVATPLPPLPPPIVPVGPGVAPLPPHGPGPIGFPYHGPFYPHFIYPRMYYAPYWDTPRVITEIYREGVLTIDFVNLRTRLPLYSASVAAIINQGQNGFSEYANLSGIQKAVQVLFSKFPIKAPKAQKQ